MSSQPTNTQDQTAVVGSIVHLLQRLKPLVGKYEINRRNQKNCDIGFNLFELISDCYYKENLHSDILYAFLNRDAKHGGSREYLKLFLEFLRSQHEPKIDLLDYADAQVEREEGRIDVLIKGLDYNGRKHAIIIENKINGAVDQYRQLPDYLKKVTDKGYDCDAIIYLRLNDNIPPDETGWDDDERKKVERILKIICAYDGTVDGTERDLLKGWILKCKAVQSNNPDVQLILRQYGGIIQKLGGDTMNMADMDDFYKTMVEDNGKKLKTALTLKELLDKLVLYRGEKIIAKFKDDRMPFRKMALHDGDRHPYFDRLDWRSANLGLDIIVEPESYLFQFWDKNDRGGEKNGLAEQILHKMGCRDEYYPCPKKGDGGVFCKEFHFPSEEAVLIIHIMEFKKKLREVTSGD